MAQLVKGTASALIIRSLPTSEGGTDTTRRLIKGQVAQVFGNSLDNEWVYVEAPAGRGWVSKQYTESVSESVDTSAAWPKVPSGLAGIEALYGKPGSAMCYAGRARFPEPLKLSWNDDKVKVFACHKLVEDVMTSVFQAIHDRGLWDLLEDFGGCYNYRQVKASSKVSTHAWGISVDINTRSNPLGAVPQMDQRIVSVFADHGFVWGGRWSRPDGMHFQRAENY